MRSIIQHNEEMECKQQASGVSRPGFCIHSDFSCLTAVMSIMQHNEEMEYKEEASGASPPFFLKTLIFLKIKFKVEGTVKMANELTNL